MIVLVRQLRIAPRFCPKLSSSLRSFSTSSRNRQENTALPPPAAEKSSFTQFLDEILFFAKYFTLLAGAIYTFKYFFVTPIIGRSMSPQFNPGIKDYGDSVCFVPRLPWTREQPLVRGKIYLFEDPGKKKEKLLEGESIDVIKRCIAIEGDKVMIQNAKSNEIEYVEIPKGHCWLESDNYTYNAGQFPDSLKYGPISNECVYGRVALAFRRLNIFPTFYPHPQNYELIDIYDALPHQRIVISPDTRNDDFMAIDAMKNLPNKEDMTNLPKGPADHAMEGKTAEEKQGWTYNHNFEVSSDKKFIDDMKKKNEQAVEDGLRRIRAPGTSITETKKEV